MTVDNQSPPGAWAEELKAAPWAYGQERDWRIDNALANVRMRGLWSEASTLANEINSLKAEIHRLTAKGDRQPHTESKQPEPSKAQP